MLAGSGWLAAWLAWQLLLGGWLWLAEVKATVLDMLWPWVADWLGGGWLGGRLARWLDTQTDIHLAGRGQPNQSLRNISQLAEA